MLTKVLVHIDKKGRTSERYISPSRAKGRFHPPRENSELNFILHEGPIDARLKKRESVWTRDDNHPMVIFFACPWCLRVNQVERHFVGKNAVSLWCSAKRCSRHLFIDFKRGLP